MSRLAATTARRTVLAAALLVVLAVGAYLLLSGGNAVTYRLLFTNAGQLVKGDQVQVGGVPVGTITDITLTSDNQAQVTVKVNKPLAPLHRGTTAQIRATSLSGVANRYISLAPGPNSAPAMPAGAALATTATQGIVDIDQLFNTLDPRTRFGLQQVIRGSAVQYGAAAADLRANARLFAPALSATDRLVAELESDQVAFTNFLLYSSRAVTDITARRDQLSGLVANGAQTFGAVASQSTALEAGLRQLPPTLRQGTTTFTNLAPTLATLTQLVDVSKPDTRTLAPFLRRLAPFLQSSVTPVSDLAAAISKPGPTNDLTDATRALPALGSALSSTAPDTIASLKDAGPIASFLRPYTPDLVGWLRDFGQGAAFYDANGHYARVSPVFADFGPSPNGTLVPITPQAGVAPLVTGQLRRCPGAATQALPDGSNPFTVSSTLDCNPTQLPPG